MLGTDRLVELTADIVSSFASANSFDREALPEVIASVHSSLAALMSGEAEGRPEARAAESADALPAGRQAGSDGPRPAVMSDPEDRGAGFVREGRQTLFDDGIVCLEDGRKVVLLSRHLRHLGMDPDQYRLKWSLPDDYPMVLPSYAAEKRRLALKTGFGRADGIRPFPSARRGSGAPARRQGKLSPNYDGAGATS